MTVGVIAEIEEGLVSFSETEGSIFEKKNRALIKSYVRV